MKKKNILFLCTGNSARSQMAEGITNSRYGEGWQAWSAGTRPAGFVHPLAIWALAEIGIEHQGHSKAIEAVDEIPFDLVVTVCDSAAEECPLWLGEGKRVHMGFPDPAVVQGEEQAQMEAFRKVRNEIEAGLKKLLLDQEDMDS